MRDEDPPESQPAQQGGIDAERDVRAGRDIAGRDIQHVTVGLGESAVLRLVLVVGLLVFLATACSFTAGAAAMAGVITALGQPAPISPDAAREMGMKLEFLSALPPGAPFEVVFSETELNSYFHYQLAEGMGLENGQARLLGDDQLAITGSMEALGGRNVIAIFETQPGEDRPLNLTNAMVQVFDTGGSLGWAAVPVFALQDLEDRANQTLSGNFIINHLEVITVVRPDAPGVQPGWLLNGVGTE